MPLVLFRRPGDGFEIDGLRIVVESARKDPRPSEVTLRVQQTGETVTIQYRESANIANATITLLHMTGTLKARLLIRAPDAQRIVRTELLDRSKP